MECKKEENSKNCTCTHSCIHHGICCDCVKRHRAKGQLPACFFPKDVECGYDRSIENFVKTYAERGAWWKNN